MRRPGRITRWLALVPIVFATVGCQDDGDVLAPETTGAEIDLDSADPCQIAARLAEVDVAYVELEPYGYHRRDPVIVEVRHLLGNLRIQAWILDRDLYGEVFLPTSVLERADFSESGLLTADESDAARQLDQALSDRCGAGLSPAGLLLAS